LSVIFNRFTPHRKNPVKQGSIHAVRLKKLRSWASPCALVPPARRWQPACRPGHRRCHG